MNQLLFRQHSQVIQLPPELQEYVEAAMKRLRMHYPSLAFSGSGDGILISGDSIDPQIIRSAVHHIVYREKISSEMG